MNTAQKIVNKQTPDAAVTWIRGSRSYKDAPVVLHLGDGLIGVNYEQDLLNRRKLLCCALASIGLTNAQIGKQLYLTHNTVKKHMDHSMSKLDASNRVHIIRRLFETGIYETVMPGPSLDLRPAELRVVDLMSQGYVSNEIGTAVDRSPNTVKSHIANIIKRTNLHERSLIVLGAFASQEIAVAEPQQLLPISEQHV